MLPLTSAGADSSAQSSPPRAPIPLTAVERGWKHRPYSILREVLGPDFHGPSSSHTAAPQLIALEVYHMLGGVADVATVRLFNSFATTGDGHRTPVAVTAGLLGFKTTDPRTPDAAALARQNNVFVAFERLEDPREHPNTVELEVRRGPVALRVKGVSIGGGNFEIVEAERGRVLAA